MCTASLQIDSKTLCFELSNSLNKMQLGSNRGVKALADLMRGTTKPRRKEEPGARTNQRIF